MGTNFDISAPPTFATEFWNIPESLNIKFVAVVVGEFKVQYTLYSYTSKINKTNMHETNTDSITTAIAIMFEIAIIIIKYN